MLSLYLCYSSSTPEETQLNDVDWRFLCIFQEQEVEDVTWAEPEDGGGGAERRGQPGVWCHRGGGSTHSETAGTLLTVYLMFQLPQYAN